MLPRLWCAGRRREGVHGVEKSRLLHAIQNEYSSFQDKKRRRRGGETSFFSSRRRTGGLSGRRRWRLDANGSLAVHWHVPNGDRVEQRGQAGIRLDKELTREKVLRNARNNSRWKDENQTRPRELSKKRCEMRDARRGRKGGWVYVCAGGQRNGEVWEEEEIWGRLG